MHFFDNIRDDTGIELDLDFARAYEHELKMWYEELQWPSPIQKNAIAQCANKYKHLTKKRLQLVDEIWKKMRLHYEMHYYDQLVLAC